ncbi:hypothetical protein JNUCC42_01410 [Brevibacterium sp. JNUCC-42]|nr:hypothetical protein JNUCC42_01410 [Brevibacterium sp. JNUCC-42]
MILDLIILLIAAKVAGHISVKLGQPSILGQLTVGIVIGPTMFGWMTSNGFAQIIQ